MSSTTCYEYCQYYYHYCCYYYYCYYDYDDDGYEQHDDLYFRDRMSVYYAVGLGRADSDEERELRNVSARRAKERHRLRFTESARRRSPMPPLVSKLRSVTVGKDDVVLVSAAS